MATLSSGGVAYRLEDSPFIVERFGIVYHFSSLKHKEKFIENVRIKEDWLCDSLSRRFHFMIDARLIADMQLYLQIEKRGFYVVIDSEVIKCPSELVLDGMRIRHRCLKKQYHNTTQLLQE